VEGGHELEKPLVFGSIVPVVREDFDRHAQRFHVHGRYDDAGLPAAKTMCPADYYLPGPALTNTRRAAAIG
jgi:hypothetical protein